MKKNAQMQIAMENELEKRNKLKKTSWKKQAEKHFFFVNYKCAMFLTRGKFDLNPQVNVSDSHYSNLLTVFFHTPH